MTSARTSRRLAAAGIREESIPDVSLFNTINDLLDISSEEESENVENYDMNIKSLKNKKQNNALLRSTSKIKTNKKQEKNLSCDYAKESTECSPPKQCRVEQLSGGLLSPSRLLDRLSIDDKDENKQQPNHPKLEGMLNKYQRARQILSSTETKSLPGREKELNDLEKFLSDHIETLNSGSLYLSGPPGTGKTACISNLLKSKKFANRFNSLIINCTSISSIGSIYKKICEELKLKVVGKTEKEHLNAIQKHLTSCRKMIVMVLDEIDQLCGKKQSVLYTIFEWPAIANSKLILIGIANSLDLTDRLLVRLNSKCELKPQLMHFGSYTKQQIIDILKSRLEQEDVLDVFPTVTIQLLAAKVSAVSGDVRRALDIARRVIDLAHQQLNSAQCLDLKQIDIGACNDTSRPINVKQVVSVLNEAYGASQNLEDDIEEAFPLQQKIILCCLMLMLRSQKNKDISLGRLHDVYKRVCIRQKIVAVDQSEFAGCVDLIETRGIIRVIRKKDPRLHKVQLQYDEEEINIALCDKQLIASILADTSCLTR